MREARGPLVWYWLRYGAPPWLLPALAISATIVAFNAERIYRYALTAPVCRKDADAPSGMKAQQMAPDGGRQWQRISRCRDGWTDVSAHARH
jgi:hypothetical protein